MDINIALFNSQFDSFIDNFQLIENKQDFSILMENQIDSLKKHNDFSEQIEGEFNDGNTLKTENLIASVGKNFPTKEVVIKELRNKFNDDLEKNDDVEIFYSTMFNSMIPQFEIVNSKSDYIQMMNTTQTDLKDEYKNQENTSFQTEDQININNFSLNKIDTHAEILTQSPLYKTEKSLSFNHEYGIRDIKEDEAVSLEKIESNFVESNSMGLNLLSADLAMEGKTKTKIQSQLSVYDHISEFNESNVVDNEHIQTDSNDVILKGEINYDPNKTEFFEKELGEHLVSMVKENDHQVKLKINPPDLGNIDIDLNWAEEQANISFYAETFQVKAAIEASIAELKNLFNEQSLSLGDVHVFHQTSDSNKRDHQDFYESQSNENIKTTIIEKAEKEIINKPLLSGSISVFV